MTPGRGWVEATEGGASSRVGVVPAETLGKSEEGREGGKQRVPGSGLDMAGHLGPTIPFQPSLCGYPAPHQLEEPPSGSPGVPPSPPESPGVTVECVTRRSAGRDSPTPTPSGDCRALRSFLHKEAEGAEVGKGLRLQADVCALLEAELTISGEKESACEPSPGN